MAENVYDRKRVPAQQLRHHEEHFWPGCTDNVRGAAAVPLSCTDSGLAGGSTREPADDDFFLGLKRGST